MANHYHAKCSIVPPHILKEIAKNGTDDQKARALVSLAQSARIRGQREILSSMGTLPAATFALGQKDRRVYDAHNKFSLPGTLKRTEGSRAVSDKAVNEAYDGAGITYDFFKKFYERESIDDRGMPLISTVHYRQGWDNAQWNGRQMVYGDGDGVYFNGFTSALDVIGHELTHGVTQFEAGLDYQDEPGALNESFSDVFGSLVKQYSKGQTADQADWLIGEGLFTAKVHGVALRSMKAPGTAYDDPVLRKDPQPDHMSKYDPTTEDNGGVHINSGIPNHAFYLVATKIEGPAWEKAGKIWYFTLRDLLRSDSKFQDCANATFEMAGRLYGDNSAEQQAVGYGWEQVGIRVAVAAIL